MDNKVSVFISYSLKGGFITLSDLQKIKTFFSTKYNCFIDALDNDSDDKQSRVLQELANAQIFVLLNSPAVAESEWVKMEISIARKRNMHFVVIDVKENIEFQIKHLFDSNFSLLIVE